VPNPVGRSAKVCHDRNESRLPRLCQASM
jgi:hypothetical protein